MTDRFREDLSFFSMLVSKIHMQIRGITMLEVDLWPILLNYILKLITARSCLSVNSEFAFHDMVKKTSRHCISLEETINRTNLVINGERRVLVLVGLCNILSSVIVAMTQTSDLFPNVNIQVDLIN